MRHWAIPLVLMIGTGPALADPVTVTGAPVYVTKADCMALVRHHPAPGTAYEPGVDVHGRYVAPADLPGSAGTVTLPERIEFDLRLNPMAYVPAAGPVTNAPAPSGQGQPPGRFNNTSLPLGHVAVDLGTGRATLDGRPLDGDQEKVVSDACRKAGYR